MVSITLVPLLQIQRDLYAIPPGGERFRGYLRTLTGGTDDMVLPLTLMNPMGKPHVAACIDALIALRAEEIAASAAARASTLLAEMTDAISLSLVVVDDAQGGWTDRNFTDAAHRFEDRYAIARGWATAVLWTSEKPSVRCVEREVLTSICRVTYVRRNGHAATLRERMRQEGIAAAFAGAAPLLDAAQLARAAAIVDAHLDTTNYPVIFACLYGDDAAIAAGYTPLGLPRDAGFELGLARARADT